MNLFRQKKIFNIHEVPYGAMLVIFIWTLIVVSSLSWNIYQSYQQNYQRAEATALSNFNRDQAFRFWVARNNGIHVKNSENNTYTLYDPASFLRQVMTTYPQFFDSSIRMVGYKPFNQINLPNAWENKMLDAFTQGAQKYLEYDMNSEHKKLGYFEPLRANTSCLACHITHGYEEGDLMGAAGVYIDLEPFIDSATKSSNFLIFTHLIFWGIGYIATVFYGQKTELRIRAYVQLEDELQDTYEKLEQRVEERTLELSKLSKAVENSPAMVVIANNSGAVEYVNPRFTEITGYSEKDILGKNPSIMKSPKTPDSTYAELWQTILAGNLWSGELCNVRQDGSEFWVSASIAPVLSETGEVSNFIAIEEDITDKKLLEETLIAAKDSAIQANRAKSEFLASMSHELRTPLNAIIGFSQLSEYDDSLTEQQKSNSRQIYKAGKHLLNLVDDVLDLTKIEIGKIKLNLQAIPLKDLINECYELINPIALEKQINLKVTHQSNDCTVQADYTRLKQIVLNLLSNAVKYTPESGQVELKCETSKNDILISIIDNGSGISAENQDRLFEPFNRLGKEGGTIQGTGIGLVITKKLIDMMGGRLEFESEINKGSMFTLVLPKHEPAPFKASPASLSTPAKIIKDRVNSSLPLELFYIEDNLTNIRLMQKIVALQVSWNLHTATTAEEGLQHIQTLQPDIILMDINLPEMNGIDAFLKIRQIEKFRHIPVIAISASAMQADIDKAIQAGFSAYITKPFDIQKVLNTIQKVLETG